MMFKQPKIALSTSSHLPQTGGSHLQQTIHSTFPNTIFPLHRITGRFVRSIYSSHTIHTLHQTKTPHADTLATTNNSVESNESLLHSLEPATTDNHSALILFTHTTHPFIP